MLSRLPGATLATVLALSVGCKDKASSPQGLDLGARCEQLGKFCGEKDKHTAKIAEECKAATKAQADKGCASKVTALYDCYEKDVCGINDRVWALGDVKVLATRKTKCAAEQTALDACMGAK